jgi:hypothetical protein
MNFMKYIRTYAWEGAGVMLLAFVVWVNIFPSGHIILGADILQPINMAQHYEEFHYEWLGRVSLFYGIFYILDSLGVSDTGQISWYLGILLFGAYSSFLYGSALMFPGASRLTRVISALFYATNTYTLYLFTATWGYSHYPVLYVFIPALTGLYLKVLETKKSNYTFIFLLVTFFASTSFGNPAFALALGVYFCVLTVALFLFRFILFDGRALRTLTVLIAGALLLNMYWILPLLPQLRSGIESIYTSEFVDLNERLRKTSNAIYDTIRLLPTSEQSRYFPSNFPYTALSFLKQPLLFLAFVPFLLVLLGWIGKSDIRTKRLYSVFLFVFVIFIALVARARFPFETLNTFLFQLPGLNTLRGWDKLATFTPFLLATLVLIFFVRYEGKRYFRALITVLLVLVILLSLPFYLGGIQTKMSYILSGQKVKNYTTSKRSALVMVPEPYTDAATFFAREGGDDKISMLPYSPGSSVGRVGLPAWKVNGPHPAHGLYTKQYVELNDSYLPGWLFAKDFDGVEHDPKWITSLFGLLGVKYVFYHKDAKPESIQEFAASREYLVDGGELHELIDNASFTLYQVNDHRLFPYVYAAPVAPTLSFAPGGLIEILEEFHEEMRPLRYSRNHPREVTVPIDALPSGQAVFLNEKYDALWQATFVDVRGTSTRLQRDDSVKYANAWKTDQSFGSGEIVIDYMPVRLLRIGERVSGGALVALILTGIWPRRRRTNYS